MSFHIFILKIKFTNKEPHQWQFVLNNNIDIILF